jgi:hypothetical protein
MLWMETPLTIQRRPELLVDFNLIAGDELVRFVGHANDGLQLLEHSLGHAFFESGSGVRGDAIMAVVGDADGHVDEFLGKGIERAGAHNLLDAFPGALQGGGIVSDGFPEIVDPIRLAGGHDVVIDGANFGARVRIFNEAECRHGIRILRNSTDCNARNARKKR